MIRFSRSYPLKDLNTFMVEARAEYFAVIEDAEELPSLAGHLPADPLLILGGGSNILFTRDYPGTVLLNRIRGIKIDWVDPYHAQITCGSGELWDNVAENVTNRKWWGAENLAYIPGTVGAAVVQNIGAYGSEISYRVVTVEGIDLITGQKKTIPGKECRFGYRTSIFKTHEYRSFFITSVTLRFMTWKGRPNLSYPALAALFPDPPSHPLEVRGAVLQLRRTKLPYLDLPGNAGSFFKNPVVEKEKIDQLLEHDPEMPFHPSDDGLFKIPAAWLIEQSGMKGVVEGSCGTWPHQPLVIINFGRASGTEIDRFAEKVAKKVEEKFDIRLEREVITL